MAKLRVCGFTTYCLDKFLHRCDYKLIEMDTDSLYLGLSCDSLEKAVYPAMAEKLRACKKNGSHGTNGVLESRDFSSCNSRAFTESHCAASTVSWKMRKERQKCPR